MTSGAVEVDKYRAAIAICGKELLLGQRWMPRLRYAANGRINDISFTTLEMVIRFGEAY